MSSAPRDKSLLRALALSSLLVLSSCRGRGPAPGSLDDFAHQYVSLAVELGEHDLDSLDFNVGPSPTPPKDGLATYARMHEKTVALRTRLSKSSTRDAARQALLLAQVDAIALRIEQLQGNDRSFDEESRILFGVVAPGDRDAEVRKALRSRIAALLQNPADTAQAYSRYDAQFVVPADRVPAVMKLALDQCRALTLGHIALPVNEHVDVQYVRLKPWSAFSRYLGDAQSVIQVNMDYPLTVDRLLTLACHEGYPGHHVFNLVRDQALVRKLNREEFMVQPTFSPQSYVSEAAASYAPFLALSDADRLRIERDVLLPAAGLKNLDCERYLALQELLYQLHTAEPPIAREYLDGRLEFVRAADAFEHETLMEHAESTLLYLNEFRTYMLAYSMGSDTVQSLVEAGNPTTDERWRRYVGLMNDPVVSLPPAIK